MKRPVPFLHTDHECVRFGLHALAAEETIVNKQNQLEARVGIDQVSLSTSHSKSIVYGIADILTINELRQLSTHIRPYLFVPVFTLLIGSVLALLLALFSKLSSKSGAKFFSLLGKFIRIRFLELGKIL
jgi:hypothetical protein